MFRMLTLAAVALGFAPVVFAGPNPPAAVTRVVFGSCADQNKPCPIWEKVAAAKPDLLVLLGDNIYADIDNGKLKPSDPAKMASCYAELAAVPAFKRIRESTYIMATWDDHDYGNNDAGEEWVHKDDAQKQFLDFFGVAADSPRRKQKGVYWAETFGPVGQRVQVIMLDGRYFRSPIRKADKPLPGTTIRPYLLNTEADATMLGADQWKWLEEQLRQPADVRLIGSGIQVVSEEHPFEKWATMPNERARLYRLIRDTKANGVVILSGDRHLGDISVAAREVGYPLYDITSSGFNQGSKAYRDPEANKYRVGGMPWGNNYGVVQIDWTSKDPLISLQLRDEDGEIAAQARVPLSKLQPGGGKPPADKKEEAVKLPEGVISPFDALKKAKGDAVTVQFEVAGGNTVSGGKRILLNSLKDFKSDDNFTVVVNEKAMTGPYEKATYDTFKGKTIRARGKLSEFQKKLQLQIDDPANLEIVEPKVEEKKDK
ncbi:MAG: alkaline phosphatase family protein [Fimbriiglobus sp.]|nr:alkaline phosphatase family protein [Fimbriiglobus sp.]